MYVCVCVCVKCEWGRAGDWRCVRCYIESVWMDLNCDSVCVCECVCVSVCVSDCLVRIVCVCV